MAQFCRKSNETKLNVQLSSKIYIHYTLKYTFTVFIVERSVIIIIIIQGAFRLDQTMHSVLRQTAVSGQLTSSING